MTKESHTQDQIESLKVLTNAIAKEARNSSAAIRDCSLIVKDNLEDIKNFMNHTEACSRRNLSIIDMLLLTIQEEGLDPKSFTQISISQVIDLAIKEYAFEDEDQKNNVTINVDGDFKFKGDETAMIYVIFNLLRNALGRGAKISIWINAKSRYLYFKDDGAVMSVEKQVSAFEDSSKLKKGSDIYSFGLLFCRKAMEAFGGKISCGSIGEKYTLFTLKF